MENSSQILMDIGNSSQIITDMGTSSQIITDMENSSQIILDMGNSSQILSHLDEEEKLRHIPIAVYLGLIGITGLIGNTIVCYIYGAVYTQSNSRIFLICLAAIDLCTCVFDIPLEIINLLNQYKFNEPILCKLSRSGNTFTTGYSTLILLAIAIDRYLKICRPLGSQISNLMAKRLCIALFFVTLALSWPAVWMYGVKSTKFIYEELTLVRKECSISDHLTNSKFPLIYNFLVLIVFVTELSLFFVLYSLIGRRVRFFAYKNERRESQSTILDSDDNTIDGDDKRKAQLKSLRRIMGNIERKGNKYLQKPKNKTERVQATDDESQISTIPISKSQDSEISSAGTLNKRNIVRPQKSITQLNQIKRKRTLARNTTYLMFIITASFIVACLPYLILVILSGVIKGFVENMSPDVRVVYRLFLRSYFLGATMNPIIYSIFDKRFKHACKGIYINLKSTICTKCGNDMT